MNRIALVGHCGPDTSYLMMAARRAAPEAQVVRVNREADLTAFLESGAGLLLVNRVLDGDFPDDGGADLIARVRAAHPGVRGMLVSNYPDAQAEAERAGALPGFGKRDIGSPMVLDRIRAGIGAAAAGVSKE